MIQAIPVGGASEPLRVVRAPLFAGYPPLVFGLSTRRGGASARPYDLNLSFRVGDDESSVRANRERFFQALGVPLARLAVPRQVHGGAVRAVSAPGEYEECDAVVTGTRGLYLAISVADCVPVFAYDPVRGVVAAVHAGWRGCRLGIVRSGLEAMRSMFGSSPGDIRAVIGQSAGACCYEVGEEVADEFEERFVVRSSGAKPRLDLHAHALALLTGFGLRREHVELLTECTICHPGEYHSYRRDGERSGRMMGVIGITNEAIPEGR